jgi:hypothetical protein
MVMVSVRVLAQSWTRTGNDIERDRLEQAAALKHHGPSLNTHLQMV